MTAKTKIPTRATITELARTGGGITDLSDPAVRRHIKQHNLKKGKDGKYNTKAVLTAIIEDQKRDGRNAGGSGGGDTLPKVKAAKVALECQILQVKLATLKKEVLNAEEVYRDDAQRAKRLRMSIESIQQHEVAKDPRKRKYLDGLFDRIMASLNNAVAN